MKKFVISLALLFCGLAGFSQPYDCSKFREGRFRIADTRAGVVTIADRRGGYQTESSESLKAVVRFRVNWTDNCSYTLRLDRVIRNENRIDFPPGLEIRIRIIETGNNTYRQEVVSPMVNGSYIVDVEKIN